LKIAGAKSEIEFGIRGMWKGRRFFIPGWKKTGFWKKPVYQGLGVTQSYDFL